MSEKIRQFLAAERPSTPCLVVDLDVIEANYCQLAGAMPHASIYYAVKANPARPILERLAALGSCFDAASPAEIDAVLAAGVSAERISYGHTIKKQRDIADAHDKGIRLFAFDSEEELRKIAAAAPGARVLCRFFMSGEGADWPLSRKFGCEIYMARDLLVEAGELGLEPYGVTFHVGSQQTDPAQWEVALGKSALLFSALRDAGIELRMVNMGGGFPAHYRSDVPDLGTYVEEIGRSLERHFGNRLPEIILEPGRSLVGDAGVLRAEVVLISRKSYGEARRWVYLDVGKFGGLPETMDEAIKYRIATPRDGGETGPVVLAGPTCDEVDVLYEDASYELPLDLEIGDPVDILAAGAYTSTYASVGFNGFAPPREYYI